MSRIWVQFVLALIVLFTCVNALGLDPGRQTHQYVQEKWNLEQGLPVSAVYSITQTPDGYVWLATAEGLARFDGVRFHVFDRANTPELKNNWIESITQDSKGDLWLATKGGGLTHYSKGKFRTYGIRDGLVNDKVSAVLEDKQKNIWVAVSKGGLFRFENEQFTHIQIRDTKKDIEIFSLFQDSKDNIWIAADHSVFVLSGKKHDRLHVVTGLANNKPRVVYEDSQNRIWIGTYGGGLYRAIDFRAHPIEDDRGVTRKVIAILEDKSGILWFGTTGDGLVRYDNGTFSAFKTSDGLSDDSIRAIFEDRESNLWVGTWGGGVNLFRNGKFTTLNKTSGLSNNIVFAMCEDKNNTLWVGTYGGGLNRFIDGRFSVQSLRSEKEPKRIAGILCSKSGDVWVGTWNEGLYLVREGESIPFPAQPMLAKVSIPAMYMDPDDHLWVATYNDGVYVIRGDTVDHYSLENGLPSTRVRLVAPDHQGNIWLATDNGLVRYRKGHLKTFTTQDGLPSDVVFSIYIDESDTMWIGTYGGGIARYDGKTFGVVNRANGLFDDVAYSITEDEKQTFWMSSNKGIYTVSKQELNDFLNGKISKVHSKAYGVSDGLKSRECNGGFTPSSWERANGRLLFPTMNGVASIDPANIETNTLPPPVVIEKVIADNKKQNIGKTIELTPGTRKIEIHYTGLSFVAPKKVKFKYKLENFDSKWSTAGTRRVAYYTNLSPGTYRFRVVAANSDGVWNKEGAVVTIRKLPYFYQTKSFAALVIVVILGLLYSAYRLRTHQIKLRNLELEGLVEERTIKLKEAHEQIVELEKETTERQMAGGFAHEIRNALAGAKMVMNKLVEPMPNGSSLSERNNSILTELFLIIKPNLSVPVLQKASLKIKELNEGERRIDDLVRKVKLSIQRGLTVTDHILYYAQVGQEQPGDEDLDVVDIVKEIYEEQKEAMRNNSIVFEFVSLDAVLLRGSRFHFYTIVNNLVLNAIEAIEQKDKGGKKNEKISVVIKKAGGNCEVQIADTGVGIPPEDLERVFEPFFSTRPYSGTGLGLGIVRKYVNMYKGTIDIKSTLNEGTAIALTFPLCKKMASEPKNS